MLDDYLSNEARERLSYEETEFNRLNSLTDIWLGAALLKLARSSQAALPLLNFADDTYDSRYIWKVAPEIARRLGGAKLVHREIDLELRGIDNYALRLVLGYTLANVGRGRATAWRLLTRSVALGNPVVIAMDRLCPGRPGDRNDRIIQLLE